MRRRGGFYYLPLLLSGSRNTQERFEHKGTVLMCS